MQAVYTHYIGDDVCTIGVGLICDEQNDKSQSVQCPAFDDGNHDGPKGASVNAQLRYGTVRHP